MPPCPANLCISDRWTPLAPPSQCRMWTGPLLCPPPWSDQDTWPQYPWWNWAEPLSLNKYFKTKVLSLQYFYYLTQIFQLEPLDSPHVYGFHLARGCQHKSVKNMFLSMFLILNPLPAEDFLLSHPWEAAQTWRILLQLTLLRSVLLPQLGWSSVQ